VVCSGVIDTEVSPLTDLYILESCMCTEGLSSLIYSNGTCIFVALDSYSLSNVDSVYCINLKANYVNSSHCICNDTIHVLMLFWPLLCMQLTNKILVYCLRIMCI